MTSEATVPAAAIEAVWKAIWDEFCPAIVPTQADIAWYTVAARAALTAALPHLSTAIHDAALEEAAEVAESLLVFADTTSGADREIVSAIRALKGKSIPAPANAALEEGNIFRHGAPEDIAEMPPDDELHAISFRTASEIQRDRLALKSTPAPAEGNEAEAAPQPEAFIIERLIDGNRKVVLREQYDPREARFWADETARRAHVVTPLFACPPVPAAPAQAPGELVKAIEYAERVISRPDAAYNKLENAINRLVSAAEPFTRQEQRGAVEQIIAKLKADGHTSMDGTYTQSSTRKIAESIAAISQEQRGAVSDAARDVLAERRRQVEAEGWTPDHDDEHTKGELADAAACYAAPHRFRGKIVPLNYTDASRYMDADAEPVGEIIVPSAWPWDGRYWKLTGDTRRDLVKAAALLVAEIERLDRAAIAATPVHQEGE